MVVRRLKNLRANGIEFTRRQVGGKFFSVNSKRQIDVHLTVADLWPTI